MVEKTTDQNWVGYVPDFIKGTVTGMRASTLAPAVNAAFEKVKGMGIPGVVNTTNNTEGVVLATNYTGKNDKGPGGLGT